MQKVLDVILIQLSLKYAGGKEAPHFNEGYSRYMKHVDQVIDLCQSVNLVSELDQTL